MAGLAAAASSLRGRLPQLAGYCAVGMAGLALGRASCAREASSPSSAPEAPQASLEDVARECQRCRTVEEVELAIKEQFQTKILKLQRAAQERIFFQAMNLEMLGLAPRLWLEVLDGRHRYASLLSRYWQRWQLSDTRLDFFEWLDEGKGSLIDLPEAPRRLLDEWRVVYLRKDDQPFFRVIIEEGTGRFLWQADGKPVTLPECSVLRTPDEVTVRTQAVARILRPRLERKLKRDELLSLALREVQLARHIGEEPLEQRLQRLAAPLIQEGLLCQLRDPFFCERLDATAEEGGHHHFEGMPRLPQQLLPDLDWDDFVKAIEHDMGCSMKTRLPMGEDAGRGKGIFVLDTYGNMYCGNKIRGVFHHSSFVRGHCVRVAGGIKIADGWLEQLSPHSGHYQPGEEHVRDMMDRWRREGVDFASVTVKPYCKEK